METRYWEIAGLVIQVAQMGFYISALDKYEDKLEELAQYLGTLGVKYEGRHFEFRDFDSDFYDQYKSLPEYDECLSNIKRQKGKSYAVYGNKLRQSVRLTRGYNQMANVNIAGTLASDTIGEMAARRAITKISERQLVDAHIISKQSAIVDAPVNIEGYSPSAVNGIIESTFSALKASSQGFNSAASGFGTSLYQVITSN